MNKTKPTIKQLEKLYKAAVDFKDIKPWTWMTDSDLFAVQDPKTGDFVFCCVMGRLGEVFALAAYLGREGLEGYMKIRAGEITQDSHNALQAQKSLMAFFENKSSLDKEDLEIIKKFKFCGNNNLPQFRSYRPGFFPWFLEAWEAELLTIVLKQAKDVALRFKGNKKLLSPPHNHLCFARINRKSGWKIIWDDGWAELKKPEKKKVNIVLDEKLEIKTRGIAKDIIDRQGVWEVDYMYAPFHIGKEGERSYFPYLFMVIDQASGFVFNSEAIELSVQHEKECQKLFIESITKAGIVPHKIEVRKAELFELLKLITELLGIKISLVENLHEIDAAYQHMREHFRRK